MPELTQIRLISTDDIDLAKYFSENSYSGLPYYHAGDVIRRNKDNTYWICVRPAGGPYKKDNSYWISLDAFDNKSTKNAGKTTIKTETKKYSVYYDVKGHNYTKFTQEWVYAKNLMEIKIAKAALHTFAALVNSDAWNLEGFEHAKEAHDALKAMGIDFLALNRFADSSKGASEDFIAKSGDYHPCSFLFAYGSPKTDSNRSKKFNNSKAAEQYGFRTDLFKTIGQVSYVQPFMTGAAVVQNGLLQGRSSNEKNYRPRFYYIQKCEFPVLSYRQF